MLALLVERHPRGLTESELIAEMIEVANPPGRVEAVESAIGDLLDVSLLVRSGDRLKPTPAGLRAGELETGL